MNIKGLHSVYFVGIGGIGMSALARYYHSQGIAVAGYDLTPSSLTKQLVDANAAVMVKNDETETKLVPALQDLLNNKDKQNDMKANIAQFARPNAADDIAEIIVKEVRSKK